MNPNALVQVSLKIILKNKKGEVLLLRNPKENTSMPGYCDFLGGRIHQTEMKTPLAKAFAREVREEVGRKVKYELKEVPVAIGRHYYFSKTYKKNQYLFWIFFEATYKGGEIEISEEHMSYEWVKLTHRNFRKYFVRGGLEGMENYFFKRFSKDKV